MVAVTNIRQGTLEEVRELVAEVLELGIRGQSLDAETPLLGNIPELDSMAVVAIITALETHFSIVIEDDDIEAETFETLGSLASFIASKTGA